MTVYCIECGIVLDADNSDRLYCPLCKKYTDFFEFETQRELEKGVASV